MSAAHPAHRPGSEPALVEVAPSPREARAQDPLAHVVTGLAVLWALGIVLREPLQQAAFLAGLVLAGGIVWKRRPALAKDVRAFGWAAVALVGWQLVSPAVAMITAGMAGWPPGSRYGQALEPLAPVVLVLLATAGIRWRVVYAVLGAGWALNVALGLYQHLVYWPFELPAFFKISVERVRERFSTEDPARYAAGGFMFHRLRFAHAGVAMLGPVLAFVAGPFRAKWRAFAATLAALLLVGVYASFARAALGTALGVFAVASLLLLRGRLRSWGLAAAACLLLAILSSAGWRNRIAGASQNLFSGERALAMEAGSRLWNAHPVLGVGFGNHKRAALAERDVTGITDLLANDSHNLWLTTLAETGVVGLLLMLAFHVLLLRALWSRFRAGSWVAAGALLAFVGFHVLSVVHYLPFHTSVALTFYFVWGAGFAASAPASSACPASPGDPAELASRAASAQSASAR